MSTSTWLLAEIVVIVCGLICGLVGGALFLTGHFHTAAALLLWAWVLTGIEDWIRARAERRAS